MTAEKDADASDSAVTTPYSGVGESTQLQSDKTKDIISGDIDIPPPMSVWNGALRFSLELASLVSIGHFGWTIVAPVPPTFSTWAQPVVAVTLPLAAATVWGVFNVPNDPSRSGAAPVPVSGKTRVLVELGFFGWGGYSLWQWNPIVAYVYTGAAVMHYVSYYKRIQWLWKN